MKLNTITEKYFICLIIGLFSVYGLYQVIIFPIEIFIHNPVDYIINIIVNIRTAIVLGLFADIALFTFPFSWKYPPHMFLIYAIPILIAYASIPITLKLSKGIVMYRRIIYAILIHLGILTSTYLIWGFPFGS
jgi:hypothetical protein